MKKIVVIILILVIVVGVVGFVIWKNSTKTTSPSNTNKSNNEEKNNTITNKSEEKTESEEKNMYSSGLHHASIVVKDYGTIKLELDADTAPITVKNFANLVNSGFYNGLTFHRIIDGFMIQGGDPLGNGTGGSDNKIKGEFSANGVKNKITHVRGTISMARSSNSYNSASSQFFIVHKDSTYLDGQYAGFGKVTEGMEIVDEICKNTPVIDSNGTVEKKNQPIIEKITMED